MPRWATISWIFRRDTLEVGFDDGIHESLLHPGARPKTCVSNGKPELGFPEDRLAIPGLEGSVLVAVPMRFSCIGSFIWGGSRLLESLLGIA